MGWFSKEKEANKAGELPELPELSNHNNFSDDSSNLPELESNKLDSLSDFEPIEELNHEEIKRAINKPRNMERSMYESPYPSRSISPHQLTKPIRPSPVSDELFSPDTENEKIPLPRQSVRTSPYPNQFMPQPRSPVKRAEPIYIRLDKFEATIEAFESIRSKIIEIENLLKKTREIRAKEERELEEWEREIEVIKARIDSIDKNIFNRLD